MSPLVYLSVFAFISAVSAQGTTFPAELATNATVDGKTFFFSKILQMKTWKDADELCKKYNTQLATVDSQSSNEQLLKAWKEAGSPRHTMWIGLNDLVEKGKFVWQGYNQAVSWTNWVLPSGPITLGNRRCVAAGFGVIATSKWNNNPCGNLMGYICST